MKTAGMREYWCPLFKARVAVLSAIEFRPDEGWLIEAELLEEPGQWPASAGTCYAWPGPGAVVVTTDRLLERSRWRPLEPEEIEADIRRALSFENWGLRPKIEEYISPEEYRRRHEQTPPRQDFSIMRGKIVLDGKDYPLQGNIELFQTEFPHPYEVEATIELISGDVVKGYLREPAPGHPCRPAWEQIRRRLRGES